LALLGERFSDERQKYRTKEKKGRRKRVSKVEQSRHFVRWSIWRTVKLENWGVKVAYSSVIMVKTESRIRGGGKKTDINSLKGGRSKTLV